MAAEGHLVGCNLGNVGEEVILMVVVLPVKADVATDACGVIAQAQ
jgi:hypothetical protein